RDETGVTKKLFEDVALRQRLEFVGIVVVTQVAAARVEHDRSSIDDSDSGSGKRHLPFQLARQPDVVLIEKGQPFTAGPADGGVSGFAQRRVFGGQEVADASVAIL